MGTQPRPARRLTAILPAVTPAEVLDTTRMHTRPTSLASAPRASPLARFAPPAHDRRYGPDRRGAGAGAGRGVAGVPRGALGWMHGRSSAAMSWRCCASTSRRVSQEYNLPQVVDFAALAALAAQVKTALGSPHACMSSTKMATTTASRERIRSDLWLSSNSGLPRGRLSPWVSHSLGTTGNDHQAFGQGPNRASTPSPSPCSGGKVYAIATTWR
jgi:hypothetical protein